MISRQTWYALTPVALVLAVGAWILPRWARPSQVEGGRIADTSIHRVEQDVGHHLYAPTWLPNGARAGSQGAIRGALRVMQEFVDSKGRTLLILAQERRSSARDEYHRDMFEVRAKSRVNFDGKTGYFVNGPTGERRLFWKEADASLIASANYLSDLELVRIARSVR